MEVTEKAIMKLCGELKEIAQAVKKLVAQREEDQKALAAAIQRLEEKIEEWP